MQEKLSDFMSENIQTWMEKAGFDIWWHDYFMLDKIFHLFNLNFLLNGWDNAT